MDDYSKALSDFYRVKWRRNRAWAGRPIDPISRAIMRSNAHYYASARGWQVALTPAQPRNNN